MHQTTIVPGKAPLSLWREILESNGTVTLSQTAWPAIERARGVVEQALASGRAIYGVNTGFGRLAQKRIPNDELKHLQRNLVVSHATGVGKLLPDHVVRLVLALKIAGLARGHSGVRPIVVERLLALLNANVLPEIPEQGSVGASGDLAPLAHLSAVLIGEGRARLRGESLPAKEALQRLELAPLELEAKEGLALLNGTQVSTALALTALFAAEANLQAALIAGALATDAIKGSDTPFDARIHEVRGQPGQIAVAAVLRGLMQGSDIRKSHLVCDRVQDPYSIRCQPQVLGPCLETIRHAAGVFEREANAVTDNPLVFEDGSVLSGGNFHAEPVAIAADALALAISEIGALSERRIALLIDVVVKRAPGIPHCRRRRQFRLHDRACHRGFAGVRKQVAGASCFGGFYPHFREPGRSCVDGDVRGTAAWRDERKHRCHSRHRVVGRSGRHRIFAAAEKFCEARSGP